MRETAAHTILPTDCEWHLSADSSALLSNLKSPVYQVRFQWPPRRHGIRCKCPLAPHSTTFSHAPPTPSPPSNELHAGTFLAADVYTQPLVALHNMLFIIVGKGARAGAERDAINHHFLTLCRLSSASFLVVYVQAALKIAIVPIVKSSTFTLAFNLTMFVALHAAASLSSTSASLSPHVIFGTSIKEQVCPSVCVGFISQNATCSSALCLSLFAVRLCSFFIHPIPGLRRPPLFLLFCRYHSLCLRPDPLFRHRPDLPCGRPNIRRHHACWSRLFLASVRRLHVRGRCCRISGRSIYRSIDV